MPDNPAAAMEQLLHAVRQNNTYTLAAAMITASARPYSIEEALELVRHIHHATYPQPTSGAYAEWSKTKDAELKKVRK